MKKSTLLLVSLFTLINVNNLSGRSTAIQDTSILKTFIENYYEVMSARDWTTYKTYFTDQAVLTTVWQESADDEATIYTNTIDGFLAQTKNGPDSQPIFEEKPISIEIKIKGDLASVWAKYEAKFGTEENLMRWKGNDLFSLIHHNDKWYISALTYVSIE